MTTAKELQKSLTWEFPHIGKAEPAAKDAAFAYCEGYKEFLNEGKTEREFTAKPVISKGSENLFLAHAHFALNKALILTYGGGVLCFKIIGSNGVSEHIYQYIRDAGFNYGFKSAFTFAVLFQYFDNQMLNIRASLGIKKCHLCLRRRG